MTTSMNGSISPGTGPEELPTPSVPDINQPVSPGTGPEELPTPSVPDINQPVSPGTGPEELPTPSLPSRPSPGGGTRYCPYGYRAATVRNNQTFTDLLLENNVSYQAMRAANPSLPTTRLAPGTRYCAPPTGTRQLCASGTTSYIMGQGENLYTLTQTLGLSPALLLSANPSLAPGDFVPGRVICIY